MANQYVSKVVLSSGETLIDLTSDTLDAEHLLTGYTAHDKSGAPITGTCDFDSNTGDDTATAAEILAGKTAHARSTKLTGTMANKGSVTGTISSKSGTYTITIYAEGYSALTARVAVGVKLSDKTAVYNGSEITADEAALTGIDGDVTYTYYSDEACTKALESAPVNSGTYYVKAVAADLVISNPAKLTIENVTGWQKIDGKWYYMNSSGAMTTVWQKIGGKWYYMNSSGAMTTGWQKIGGKWYYMNSSGVMTTGWQKIGGKWYYMNSSGQMVTGTQVIGGKKYVFNSSGVWVK